MDTTMLEKNRKIFLTDTENNLYPVKNTIGYDYQQSVIPDHDPASTRLILA
jgi:hypothetical protein